MLHQKFKVLPFDTAKSLVNNFVISRIDYCNSLLTGLPNYALDRLQHVMNAAARKLCSAGKYSHIIGLLRDRLHWLPVAQRIQFKLCLMITKRCMDWPLHIYQSSVQVPMWKVELGRLLAVTL